MKIHEKLKARRLELGLTLEEVAARVGVNDSTISRWERGDIANMKRDKILKYAEALDISPAVIMGWEPEPEIKTKKRPPTLAELRGLTPRINVEYVDVSDLNDRQKKLLLAYLEVLRKV